MEEKKLTKKDMFLQIRDILETKDIEDKEGLIEFVDNQIASLEKKAVKAKEKAAEKRAVGDELKDLVKSLLTNDYQTINDLLEQIDGADVTRAKVQARVTALVNDGYAEKADVETEAGKTAKAYRIAE